MLLFEKLVKVGEIELSARSVSEIGWEVEVGFSQVGELVSAFILSAEKSSALAYELGEVEMKTTTTYPDDLYEA
mgnify:CR=1 FL=1